MAKVWTTVSCKTGKMRVRGVCYRFRVRLSAVSTVEFSQGERCEPDFREIIVEFWRVVPSTATFCSRFDLLGRRPLLREVVCEMSLPILRPRHERALLGEDQERREEVEAHLN